MPKKPRVGKSDERMVILLGTAEDKNYYKIRFAGENVKGSKGKKLPAMLKIRAALAEDKDNFPSVPRDEILDKWIDESVIEWKQKTKGDHV